MTEGERGEKKSNSQTLTAAVVVVIVAVVTVGVVAGFSISHSKEAKVTFTSTEIPYKLNLVEVYPLTALARGILNNFTVNSSHYSITLNNGNYSYVAFYPSSYNDTNYAASNGVYRVSGHPLTIKLDF